MKLVFWRAVASVTLARCAKRAPQFVRREVQSVKGQVIWKGMRFTSWMIAVSMIAVTALAAAGCGQKGPVIEKHEVYPVEGQVIWKKKPLAGAYVTFHPKGWKLHDSAPYPAAVTGEDGMYRLDTYGKGDGAPAGKYAITVTAPDRTVKTMSPPNLLPKEFSSPDTSGLEVEVANGANNVPPIDLGGTPDEGAEAGAKEAGKEAAKKGAR